MQLLLISDDDTELRETTASESEKEGERSNSRIELEDRTRGYNSRVQPSRLGVRTASDVSRSELAPPENWVVPSLAYMIFQNTHTHIYTYTE